MYGYAEANMSSEIDIPMVPQASLTSSARNNLRVIQVVQVEVFSKVDAREAGLRQEG